MNIEKLPVPLGLCKSCQAEAIEHGLEYCAHNRFGAVYIAAGNVKAWQLYGPIEEEAFNFVITALKISKVTVTLPAVPFADRPEEKHPRQKTHD